ncbi:hypothetical protein L6452_03915 [Arctium lappa]|uniref:Uncharacterized protein n=1 Tax=Arctium lappa TaxID=4217 RepID=A0ACB9FQ67_ARCLA|nr:hypothetical protein L6452_03915 [Arctium lappa]
MEHRNPLGSKVKRFQVLTGQGSIVSVLTKSCRWADGIAGKSSKSWGRGILLIDFIPSSLLFQNPKPKTLDSINPLLYIVQPQIRRGEYFI